MQWTRTEFSSLLHHLPRSLSDLLHHEDKKLVKAANAGFTVKKAQQEQEHPFIISDDVVKALASTASISLQKDIDPAISRSQHNMDLLIRDFLHTLPMYEPCSKDAELLLEHWRKILLEQPRRLAEAKTSYWHSENARQFWQERIRHLEPDQLHFVDNWEYAAGTPLPHPSTLGAIKSKQWQELVIRNRLYHLTEYLLRMG